MTGHCRAMRFSRERVLRIIGFHPSWRERYPHVTLTDEQAEKVKAYMIEKGVLRSANRTATTGRGFFDVAGV